MKDAFAEFANSMSKAENPYSSTKVGTDLSLSSHIPFGIPTGIPELDLALHRPGYPVGRIIELYGPQASGKSSVGLHALASIQRMGGLAMFIDAEKCWDPARARSLGVDPSKVLVVDADSIEASFRAIENSLDTLEKVQSTQPLLAVVDSITGVISEREHERTMGEEFRVGQDAKVIRTGMRLLNHRIAKAKATVIFVNHSIDKIGVMFGEKSDSSGGKALKYFASVRIAMSFISTVADGKGEDRVRRGSEVQVKLQKSKIGSNDYPKFKVDLLDETGFDLYEGLFEGFQRTGDLEKVNAKTYFFRSTETQLGKADWKTLIDQNGGPLVMYEKFLKSAEEKGLVKPYGVLEVVRELSASDSK